MTHKTIPLGLIRQLKRHEGLSLKLYRCPAGYYTIGYGRNIEMNGITETEAESLLMNDVLTAAKDAETYLGLDLYEDLGEVRRAVIINMAFNLGLPKLMSFKRLKNALLERDFNLAADCMKQSLWFSQVKRRGAELVIQMRTNEWQ